MILMSRNRKVSISDFICPGCGNKIPLPRHMNHTREKGHIKDLYCPFCKDIMKMKEIRSIDA